MTWSRRSSSPRALGEPREIASLPGQYQHTVDSLVAEVRALASLGVGGVILFGVPATKDELGSGAWDPRGIAQVALRALRDEFGDDLVVMADLCLDEYTDHGHCGVASRRRTVDNDATLELYGRAAVAQAEAGAPVVAPSGMMDGQVGAIRAALDGAGFDDTIILAYAAKYASGLYGPFRDAVEVEIVEGGDRRATSRTTATVARPCARRAPTSTQGADIVMVKPAMSYLDVRERPAPRARRAAVRLSRQWRVRDGEGRREPTAGSTARRSPSNS